MTQKISPLTPRIIKMIRRSTLARCGAADHAAGVKRFQTKWWTDLSPSPAYLTTLIASSSSSAQMASAISGELPIVGGGVCAGTGTSACECVCERETHRGTETQKHREVETETETEVEVEVEVETETETETEVETEVETEAETEAETETERETETETECVYV